MCLYGLLGCLQCHSMPCQTKNNIMKTVNPSKFLNITHPHDFSHSYNYRNWGKLTHKFFIFFSLHVIFRCLQWHSMLSKIKNNINAHMTSAIATIMDSNKYIMGMRTVCTQIQYMYLSAKTDLVLLPGKSHPWLKLHCKKNFRSASVLLNMKLRHMKLRL